MEKRAPIATDLTDLYASRSSKPTVVIAPRTRTFDFDLFAIWQYRELLYFLVWRNVIVRYKQTVVGGAWVILQPLIAMGMLTVVFGYLMRVPSGGVPYPVFAYTALLPWSYLAQALSRGGGGLVANAGLVTKVYFPRLLIPLSSVVTPLVDFLFTLLIFFGLTAWYGIAPSWRLLAMPAFLMLAVATALGVTLFLSALNVKYRDVGAVIPFITQIWLYGSPVIYPTSVVPERWRTVYALNPMVAIIDGFRWSLLGTAPPDSAMLGSTVVLVAATLLGGIIYFRRTERTFADVI
jgi:lipopolysaccharide transport system permease protein